MEHPPKIWLALRLSYTNGVNPRHTDVDVGLCGGHGSVMEAMGQLWISFLSTLAEERMGFICPRSQYCSSGTSWRLQASMKPMLPPQLTEDSCTWCHSGPVQSSAWRKARRDVVSTTSRPPARSTRAASANDRA
eukprot:scaffold297942_cov33-Tisochrysis_lutea.AAC.2